MIILFVGDTHHDLWHMIDVIIPAAKEHKAKTVFQLGDFGYWPRREAGQIFLRNLQKILSEEDIKLIFLDGNHEDHKLLAELDTSKRDNNGFIQVTDNIFYAPRGHRWTWDGLSFMSLGGAYSIDRNFRRVGETFFFEEVISDEDVDSALDGPNVDFLLTHDAPLNVDIDLILLCEGRSYMYVSESAANRSKIQKVVDTLSPKIVLHGHYHIRYSKYLGETMVVGLGPNGSGPDSYVAIDLSLYSNKKD